MGLLGDDHTPGTSAVVDPPRESQIPRAGDEQLINRPAVIYLFAG